MFPLAAMGYQYWDVPALAATLEQMDAICVDVRMYPTSSRPEWRKEALQAALGPRYRHLPDLGNPNAGGRGGGLALFRPERGIPRLLAWMEEQPVVILCKCPDWRHCHRRLIVERVREATRSVACPEGIAIIHLEPPPPDLAPGELIATTLHQPWASLFVVEYYAPDCGKRDETRSWPTGHRGWLAIHAAKGGLSKRELADYCAEPLFRSALARIGITQPSELPRGAVVAVGCLRSCVPTEERYPTPTPADPNWHFGNFSPGRWAWQLDPIIALPEPIEASGHQKLWTWRPPASVWTLLERAEAGEAAPPPPPPRPSIPVPTRAVRRPRAQPTQAPVSDAEAQQLSLW